jgi:DNA-binding XRE family transcriptional regulator
MKAKKNKITYFDAHIDQKYGPRGTKKREEFERGYEAFKLGVILKELRRKKNLTQEQLADKCGTTKNYISRIENDASDIRLSTLMKIVNDGLGARLEISVHY